MVEISSLITGQYINAPSHNAHTHAHTHTHTKVNKRNKSLY